MVSPDRWNDCVDGYKFRLNITIDNYWGWGVNFGAIFCWGLGNGVLRLVGIVLGDV
jgi:hypothetical protein